MKYYTIVNPTKSTLSEEEILAQYYSYWYEKMCDKFGKDHVDANYTKEDCIEDWCITNSAEPNYWREMKDCIA